MLKKYILTIGIIIYSISNFFAQNKIGIYINNISSHSRNVPRGLLMGRIYEDRFVTTFETRSYNNIGFGILWNEKVNDKFSLDFALGYTKLGYESSVDAGYSPYGITFAFVEEEGYPIRYKERYVGSYFNFDAKVRYKIREQLYAYSGISSLIQPYNYQSLEVEVFAPSSPSAGFRYEFGDYGYFPSSTRWDRINLTFSGGFLYEIYNGFVLDASYLIGLEPYQRDDKLYHQAFNVGLRYEFDVAKYKARRIERRMNKSKKAI